MWARVIYAVRKPLASLILCLVTISSSIRYFWRLVNWRPLFPTYAISTNYIYNDIYQKENDVSPFSYCTLSLFWPINRISYKLFRLQSICYKTFNRSPQFVFYFRACSKIWSNLILRMNYLTLIRNYLLRYLECFCLLFID